MNNFLRVSEDKWVAISEIVSINRNGSVFSAKLKDGRDPEVAHQDGIDEIKDAFGLADPDDQPLESH